MMQQFLLAAALALKVFSVYFAAVLVLGLFRKPADIPCSQPRTRFAVVIAARNEGAVIGGLVRSLRTQEYPAELCDVYVVPNNCTDDTAARAAAAGARIFLTRGNVHSKGEALHQAFECLMREDYDAFLVFDADNLVDRRFLARCNDAFCSGAKVIKGRHLAQDPGGHWLAGCYDIYFRGFDLLFNRPRAALGLSCKLVGTGFGMTNATLRALGGWETSTIAEDAEFSARCAAAGIRVTWVKDAVTYDQQPRSFRVSLIQRRRWCSGVMQVAPVAVPMLVRGNAHSAPFRRDMACFLLTPYAQACAFLLTFAASVIALLSGGTNPAAVLAGLLLSALAFYAGMAAAAYALLRITHAWQPGMGRAVGMFPLFMASFLPLQILALFKKTTGWRAIAHTAQPVHSPLAAD